MKVRRVDGMYIREEDYVPPKRGYVSSWSSIENFPTGRLRLQAYSPCGNVDWTRQWKETPKKDLIKQVKSIVRTLQKEVGEVARLVEKEKQIAELKRQEWKRQQERRVAEEAIRRADQAEKESLEELKRVIDAWGEVNRIELFFREAEKHSANLDPEEQIYILERLKLAREMIGSIDALGYFRQWRTPAERLGK